MVLLTRNAGNNVSRTKSMVIRDNIFNKNVLGSNRNIAKIRFFLSTHRNKDEAKRNTLPHLSLL